jgi:hypothetical protein
VSIAAVIGFARRRRTPEPATRRVVAPPAERAATAGTRRTAPWRARRRSRTTSQLPAGSGSHNAKLGAPRRFDSRREHRASSTPAGAATASARTPSEPVRPPPPANPDADVADLHPPRTRPRRPTRRRRARRQLAGPWAWAGYRVSAQASAETATGTSWTRTESVMPTPWPHRADHGRATITLDHPPPSAPNGRQPSPTGPETWSRP